MLPTPSTSHVSYDRIYEPAEDSYLLLDTLASPSETAFLHNRFPHDSPSPLVLEVGTGSGVVLAFATAHSNTIFGRSDVLSLGTDINTFACQATSETVKRAIQDNQTGPASTPSLLLDTIVGDLGSALRATCVDVLIFNPPYVPTEALPVPSTTDSLSVTPSELFERDSHLLSLSYAGGADGMETADRLLAELPKVLSNRGLAYILLCAQNKPEEVKARIRAWSGGWQVETATSSGKKAGWEKLVVLRIWRP